MEGLSVEKVAWSVDCGTLAGILNKSDTSSFNYFTEGSVITKIDVLGNVWTEVIIFRYGRINFFFSTRCGCILLNIQASFYKFYVGAFHPVTGYEGS